MRNDPAENGGLFVGRRPGTAPVRFRALPERGSALRQRFDGSLAGILLGAMIVLSLLCWGPIPLACLWIGSQVDYLSGSVSIGILVSFVGLFTFLFGALAISGVTDHVDADFVRLVAVLVIVMLLTSVLPPILRRIPSRERSHACGLPASPLSASMLPPDEAGDLLAIAGRLEKLAPGTGELASSITREAAHLRQLARSPAR